MNPTDKPQGPSGSKQARRHRALIILIMTVFILIPLILGTLRLAGVL